MSKQNTSGKKIRARTTDVAFTYRMGAGFAGEVNRTHPFSVVPSLQDGTSPVKLYGHPVLYSSANNSARGFVAGDTAVTKIDGIVVRPYPTQNYSNTAFGAAVSFGAGAPNTSGILDILESGFIMANVVGTAPTKKGAVYIWCAASTGNHIQGGFETAASAGNTAAITNAFFTGGVDANGVAEIRVHVA